jgi:hypothetical protein
LKWNATETGTIRRHYLSRKGYWHIFFIFLAVSSAALKLEGNFSRTFLVSKKYRKKYIIWLQVCIIPGGKNLWVLCESYCVSYVTQATVSLCEGWRHNAHSS